MFTAISLLFFAGAASAWRHEPTRDELLALLHAGVPKNVPPDFDCGMRSLALEFARTLQPSRPERAFAAISDALQLAQCNETAATPLPPPAPPLPVPPAPAAPTSTLFVDAALGSDASHDGPLASLPAAVLRARALPRPVTIYLRGGAPHRLAAPLQLTAADSHLTIAAFPGEAPVVTSGLLLNTSWAPAPAPAPAAAAACSFFPGENAMYGDWPSPALVNGSAFPSAAA